MLNWYIFPYSYVYNVDVYEAAGVEPPTSWAEMVAASQALADVARRARAILVVELSAGQMVEDVRLAVDSTPVFFHGRTGGMVPTPREVVDRLRVAWALTAARP